jgi:hypothetical protein
LGAVTKAPPLRTSLSTSQSGGLDIAWAVRHRTVAAERAAVAGFGFQPFTAMMEPCMVAICSIACEWLALANIDVEAASGVHYSSRVIALESSQWIAYRQWPPEV